MERPTQWTFEKCFLPAFMMPMETPMASPTEQRTSSEPNTPGVRFLC